MDGNQNKYLFDENCYIKCRDPKWVQEELSVVL